MAITTAKSLFDSSNTKWEMLLHRNRVPKGHWCKVCKYTTLHKKCVFFSTIPRFLWIIGQEAVSQAVLTGKLMCECQKLRDGLKLIQSGSVEEGVKVVSECASEGVSEANHTMGLWFLHGRNVPQSDEKAFAHFLKAANDGSANSMYALATMLEEGRGVGQDTVQAVKWFEKGAELGHAGCQYRMGVVLQKQKANVIKSTRYFKSAADAGIASAQFEYAKCLFDGIGVKQDAKEGLKYLTLSVKQKYPDACYLLGVSYLQGTIVEQDLSKAALYVKMAADANHIEAQLAYVKFLEDGLGVEANTELAKETLKKAADSGNTEAMFLYAFYLESGKYDSVDQEQAFEYYRMAADNGYSRAQLIVGNKAKEKGEFDLAARYYRMAADMNNTMAMFELGMMLLEGKGVDQNEHRGIEMVKRGADHHIAAAQLMYAKYLLKKMKNKQDEEKFIEYLKMAADNGNKEAIELYIQCLDNGFCVEKNEREAMRYQDKLSQ